MSLPRLTEIMENHFGKGWKSEKVTEDTEGSTHTVKDSPGKVAMLYVTSAVDVTLKDDTTAKWEAVNDATVDFSNAPIQCDTSIKLTFDGNADAWIIYK